MKSLLSVAVVLAAFVISSPIIKADTELEGTMKKMADAAHQLGPDLKQTDDTKHNKAQDLQNVATIKDGATKSLSATPKLAGNLPPDQKQAMTTNFQTSMGSFIKDIDTMNADIQADKWDAARTDYDRVMADEKAGHKEFRAKK